MQQEEKTWEDADKEDNWQQDGEEEVPAPPPSEEEIGREGVRSEKEPKVEICKGKENNEEDEENWEEISLRDEQRMSCQLYMRALR